MIENRSTRIIAYYLPQFHPIPENDKWWGKGFTEWTNVAKAKPLFKGHYQPRIPSDLGFYDLRLEEVREEQAHLAQEAGIEGFCYYHYWFGNGKRLLEKPFNEVLHSGKPNFPFCLCWANHSWSNKTWQKGTFWNKDTIFMQQKYLGDADYIEHFYCVLKAFEDSRYMKVDGKPIFTIYDPHNFDDVSIFINVWRNLAIKNGLKGIHFVGMTSSSLSIRPKNDKNPFRKLPSINDSGQIYKRVLEMGFDAVNSYGKRRAEMMVKGRYFNLFSLIRQRLGSGTTVKYEYKDIIRNIFSPEDSWENVYPTIIPQWDRSPRIGIADGIYINSNPELFGQHVKDAVKRVSKKDDEHRLIYLKSWNEWAEGNYIEPDLKYGKGYINQLKKSLDENSIY